MSLEKTNQASRTGTIMPTPAEPVVGQLTNIKKKRRTRLNYEQATELATLRQENAQLKAEVAHATLIIAAQKKLALALARLCML